jgi:opacity protein-like surface antigen
MNNTLNRLPAHALLALLILAALPALAQNGRFYLRGDLGGNLTSDTDLREFFGPVTPGSKIKFDPGIRFGAAFGYEITEWFSAEGQTGIMANTIKSITDSTTHDAVFSNVPFLANVRFQLPRSRFTPYIGGGVGFSTAVLDADDIEVNGVFMNGSDADAVFAYQGFGGFLYRINSQMAVSLEYRYFWADPAQWRADISFGTDTDRIRFGGTETHTLSLAFSYHF